MPIAEYLNNHGRFAMIKLPSFRTVARVERGTFSLVAHKAHRRLSDLRKYYRAHLRVTAFPTQPFESIYYVPSENLRDFEVQSNRAHRNARKFMIEVRKNWKDLTAEAREEVVDLLTIRWTNSGSNRTMIHTEYVNPSMNSFDKQIAAGPGVQELMFSYLQINMHQGREPKFKAYQAIDTMLWHWMVDAESAICAAITKSLTWLATRPKIYQVVTDATYIGRSWSRDITKVPLQHFCAWLRVLGRGEASMVIVELNDKLQKFYSEWRGRNRQDGKSTSRKSAIKVLSTVPKYIDRFSAAMDSPLDVDALVVRA